MKVLRIDRSCEEFYLLMGPVFGSRVIEQDTKDRFYDDPGKVWYLIPGHGAVSVLGYTIKNFWAAAPETAMQLLEAMKEEYSWLDGIVPNKHENSFKKAGFTCLGHRKNFLEVHYRAKD